jgi:iron(III) transport system permease protein
VLVPLVRPSLFATGVLVFMASLRELVTAIFLYTSSTQTVLINIYSFWTEGYLELASALSIVLLVIVAALYLVVHRVLGSAAAVR